MKECKQTATASEINQEKESDQFGQGLPIPYNPKTSTQTGERTTSHENKNLTNKQNFEEEKLWLILLNDSKPLSSTFHNNKNNARVGCKADRLSP
jgi:hypothetical protein